MNHATRYRRWCSFLVVTAAALGVLCVQPALAQAAAGEMPAPAAAAGEMKTVAVLGVASYDELAGDVGFLGSLVGQPQASQMVEGGIALFTQGRGLASIDRAMPWGVIMQTDGMRFMPVACLPVTKVDDLLQVAENYGAQVQDAAEGVKEVSLPNGQSLFVTSQGKWAFLAQSAESLAHLPADPQKTLADLVADYDVALQFSIQNIPEHYRQMALAGLQAGLQRALQNQSGTDEQRELQRKIAEIKQKQLVTMIQELDSLTIGWAVDAEQQNTYLDVAYTFVPDSEMAKQIASYGQSKTNFAGFYQPNAAFTGTVVSKGNAEMMQADIEQFKAFMAGIRGQFSDAIDRHTDFSEDKRAAQKEAMNDLLDAAQATIEGGELDGSAAVQLSPGASTVVVAMLVQQPEKVEQALRKLAETSKDDPDFPGVTWNASSHAGVNFHVIRVPVPGDEEPLRKLFGDETEWAVGIGPKAVYFAMGNDWQSAMNQAIDASAADPDKAVPPFELSLSLGQIMKTAAVVGKESDRAKAQMVADMLQDQAQGRDHVRIVGKYIPNGVQSRIEVEEGVLRAIGAVAAQAQQAAQQQGM